MRTTPKTCFSHHCHQTATPKQNHPPPPRTTHSQTATPKTTEPSPHRPLTLCHTPTLKPLTPPACALSLSRCAAARVAPPPRNHPSSAVRTVIQDHPVASLPISASRLHQICEPSPSKPRLCRKLLRESIIPEHPSSALATEPTSTFIPAIAWSVNKVMLYEGKCPSKST